MADDIFVTGRIRPREPGHSSVPDRLAKYWPNGDPDALPAGHGAVLGVPGQAGDKKAILTALHDACDRIAKACDAYAKAIDDARTHLEHLLIGAGIAVAVTT